MSGTPHGGTSIGAGLTLDERDALDAARRRLRGGLTVLLRLSYGHGHVEEVFLRHAPDREALAVLVESMQEAMRVVDDTFTAAAARRREVTR